MRMDRSQARSAGSSGQKSNEEGYKWFHGRQVESGFLIPCHWRSQRRGDFLDRAAVDPLDQGGASPALKHIRICFL